VYRGLGHLPGAWLAEALGWRLTGVGDRAGLLAAADGCPVVGVAVQVAALVDASPDWLTDRRAAIHGDPRLRREVLAPIECQGVHRG
ncbi:MAG: hypothetical protein ABMB14_07470, partial [Myxococcota bacterium]